MNIINKLASSLHRRDEIPNQELAEEIVRTSDLQAIKDLVGFLHHKDKVVQNDCIKVLYEIGVHSPKLISDYLDDFVKLLDSKNNRLKWGAMTALNTIASDVPEDVYRVLTKILDAADSGSVIARDHAVGILIKLCSEEQFANSAVSLLIEQLQTCPTNQLPMYSERALPIVNRKNKTLFINALASRISDIGKEVKRKRVEKVIKKASSI